MSKINRYIWIWWAQTYSTVHFLFIIKQNWKNTRAWPILKSSSISFWFKNLFPSMNNKNFTERWPQRAPLPFLYKVSIVVLIDFIAILLTPGIFLIQIVNTNMYFRHLYSKKYIKMYIPESYVFKFQNEYQRSIFISEEVEKDHSTRNCMHYNATELDFQKKIN